MKLASQGCWSGRKMLKPNPNRLNPYMQQLCPKPGWLVRYVGIGCRNLPPVSLQKPVLLLLLADLYIFVLPDAALIYNWNHMHFLTLSQCSVACNAPVYLANSVINVRYHFGGSFIDFNVRSEEETFVFWIVVICGFGVLSSGPSFLIASHCRICSKVASVTQLTQTVVDHERVPSVKLTCCHRAATTVALTNCMHRWPDIMTMWL